jgi:hypothetical protein
MFRIYCLYRELDLQVFLGKARYAEPETTTLEIKTRQAPQPPCVKTHGSRKMPEVRGDNKTSLRMSEL